MKTTKRSSSSLPLRKKKRRARCRPPRAGVLHRRAKWGQWPKAPEKGKPNVPHARSRCYLCDLDDGELVALVVSSRAWQETFKSYCDDLDRRDPGPGPSPGYEAWEYEAFLTFKGVGGHRTDGSARRHLTSEEGRSARWLLGFDVPRDHLRDRRYAPRQKGKPHRRTMDGVPSTSAISRHRKRISEEKRLKLWQECLRLLIRYHLIEFPAFREEARLGGIDGITMKSIYTAALYDRDTREVTNASRITEGFEGGAAMGKGLPRSKRGHGYLVVVPATLTSRLVLGVPHVGPMPGDERQAGLHLIEQELEQHVKAYVDWVAPGVLVMDGIYFTKEIFRAAYRAGYVPQIHKVAHPRGGLKALGLEPDGTPIAPESPATDDLADDAAVEAMLREDIELVDVPGKLMETRNNYLKHLDMRWEVEGSPGWYVNGLREVWCLHGIQATGARNGLRADRSATSAVVGRCDQCGPICITAGTKRVSDAKVVDVLTDDPAAVAEADWSIGDPLTYNDPKAERLGEARFANLEGLLGNVKVRFNVFADRNRCMRLRQAELLAVPAFAFQHAIAMHYRRCVQAAEDGREIPQPGPVPGSKHAADHRTVAERA